MYTELSTGSANLFVYLALNRICKRKTGVTVLVRPSLLLVSLFSPLSHRIGQTKSVAGLSLPPSLSLPLSLLLAHSNVHAHAYKCARVLSSSFPVTSPSLSVDLSYLTSLHSLPSAPSHSLSFPFAREFSLDVSPLSCMVGVFSLCLPAIFLSCLFYTHKGISYTHKLV